MPIASLTGQHGRKRPLPEQSSALYSNIHTLAWFLIGFLVSIGARAEDTWVMMSEPYETRSVSKIGKGLFSALDFSGGNLEGSNTSAMTGHIFFAGHQDYAIGLGLGQTAIGGVKYRHAAVEGAMKGRGVSFYAAAGHRFGGAADSVFGRLGMEVFLGAGLKINLGMEYEALSGREVIHLAFGPTHSSSKSWEPFFDASGVRGETRAIGGIRFYFGPRGRKRPEASNVFHVIPNMAAGEVRALLSEGDDAKESVPFNTTSTPEATTPAQSRGLATATNRRSSGSGNGSANRANPLGAQAAVSAAQGGRP